MSSGTDRMCAYKNKDLDCPTDTPIMGRILTPMFRCTSKQGSHGRYYLKSDVGDILFICDVNFVLDAVAHNIYLESIGEQNTRSASPVFTLL